VFIRGAFLDHRYRYGFVDFLVVLIDAYAHVVARLKIANVCLAARGVEVFSRTSDGDGLHSLVVFLQHDSLIAYVSQYPGESRYVRLTSLRRSSRTALRITLARVSTAAARISATGVSTTAAGNDDLAESGNAGHQENERHR
jgi:hypothetical protein